MIRQSYKTSIGRLLLVVLLVFGLILVAACNPANTQPTTTPTTPSSTSEPTVEPSPTPSPTPSSPEVTTPPTGELKVYFIDVGQGDAILIDFQDTEILIDGGDRSPGIIKYLNQYVDGALKVMVATHPHADHIGGLIAVLDAFTVNQI